MATSDIESDMSLAIINNIPPDYHSCDLRNYFSQFIESKGFECFHFRHRPETRVFEKPEKSELNGNVAEPAVTVSDLLTKDKCTTCCVVQLKTEQLKKLMRMYNRKNWIDKNGDIMKQICYITKVRTPKEKEAQKLLTRGELKVIPADRESFSESDLRKLPELHPPDLMPQGNVGTPTMTFMTYIKECRLPPSVIKKLGLTFPRVRSSKQYGSVPFDYGGEVRNGASENDEEVYTATGHEISAGLDETNDAIPDLATVQERAETTGSLSQPGKTTTNNELPQPQHVCGSETNIDADKQTDEQTEELLEGKMKKRKRKKKHSWKDEEAKKRLEMNIEEKYIGQKDESEGDNDSCEEWERHEAMYDDVSNQERNKERLFEEEIELKWEKGGSGLVFYTDAQYWQAQEGDFDEQTADDHDVDMSAYYEEGAGDKDIKDFLTIRQEKRRRDGIEGTDRFNTGIAKKCTNKTNDEEANGSEKIGKFEVHTRGVGRKILESQGWKDGQGLGTTVIGMSDALDNEGQLPKDKRGLGYHGEKLSRNPRPAKRQVIISTVYDDPNNTDPSEPLKRRHEPYHLKYRDEVKFNKRDTLNDTKD